MFDCICVDSRWPYCVGRPLNPSALSRIRWAWPQLIKQWFYKLFVAYRVNFFERYKIGSGWKIHVGNYCQIKEIKSDTRYPNKEHTGANCIKQLQGLNVLGSMVRLRPLRQNQFTDRYTAALALGPGRGDPNQTNGASNWNHSLNRELTVCQYWVLNSFRRFADCEITHSDSSRCDAIPSIRYGNLLA